jgi:hypothetical protein
VHLLLHVKKLLLFGRRQLLGQHPGLRLLRRVL